MTPTRWPIRGRVTAVAALAGLVATVAVGSVAIWRTRNAAHEELDIFLSQEAAEALALVSRGGEFSSLVDVTSASGPSQRVALYELGGELIDTTALPPPTPDVSVPRSRFEVASAPDGSGLYRVLVVPFEAEAGARVLVVASPLQYVERRVRESVLAIVPLVLVAVAGVALLGYMLTGLALKPVEDLRASAAAYADHPDGRRLVVPATNDELSALATTLNGALDAVDTTIAGQRLFVAEASHELRTPVARARAEIEYALRPTRSHDELRAALAAVDQHLTEFSEVSDGLLDLLSATGTGEPARMVSGPTLMKLVSGALAHRPSLETSWDAKLSVTTPRCAPRALVGAVRNLVDNGYEHGAEPVGLAVTIESANMVFRVTDHGPGVDPELVDTIRLPFVRGSDGRGRAGLGLAIAARVAEQHGGSLAITSSNPGCVAELMVPLDGGSYPQ